MVAQKISATAVWVLLAALTVGIYSIPASAAFIHYNRDYVTYTDPWGDSHPDNPPQPDEAMEAYAAQFTDLRTGDAYVPSNSSRDLAHGLTPTLISGTSDFRSGPIAKLTDGVIGADLDEPDDSFFFATASTAGGFQGDIGFDLGAVHEIEQINTYSWHVQWNAGGKANQKYELYASDGTAEDFAADDKTSPGWTPLAAVSTAGHYGAFDDGQFGVSIRPQTGHSLGNFRYFIFSISSPGSTEAGSKDGTYFQEIDIVKTLPEPSTPALLVAGLVGLLAYAWRKRR